MSISSPKIELQRIRIVAEFSEEADSTSFGFALPLLRLQGSKSKLFVELPAELVEYSIGIKGHARLVVLLLHLDKFAHEFRLCLNHAKLLLLVGHVHVTVQGASF